MDLILVNLVKTEVHLPLDDTSSLLSLLEGSDDRVHRLGNDASAINVDRVEHSHRKSLARAGLPIHKVGSIVPLKHIVDQRQAGLGEHGVLVSVLVEYTVELVDSFLFLWNVQLNELRVLPVGERALPLGLVGLVAPQSRVEHRVLYLMSKRRPDAHEHAHGFQSLLANRPVTVHVACLVVMPTEGHVVLSHFSIKILILHVAVVNADVVANRCAEDLTAELPPSVVYVLVSSRQA